MPRDLRRKQKRETPALSLCRFSVETAVWDQALRQLSSLMNVAGVDVDRQYVLVTAGESPVGSQRPCDSSTIILETGSGGVYVRTEITGEIAKTGYFTMPLTTLIQLKWGSDKLLLATIPDEKVVEYRGRIRGKLTVPTSPDPIIRNRPKMENFEYDTFNIPEFVQILASSYFKAESIEEGIDDVLVRIDITPTKKKKHTLSIAVHDMYRAAFSEGICELQRTEPYTYVLPGSVLQGFLRGCGKHGDFNVATTDTTLIFQSGSLIMVSPLAVVEVRDVRAWAQSFVSDESDFSFVTDTGNLIEALQEVTSVQDRDPDVERRLHIRSGVNNGLILSVQGGLGSAKRKVDAHSASKGQVDLDFGLLSDSLNIFRKDNRPIRCTVWDGAVRLDTQGAVHSTHFLVTMESQ